jgi:hypothetical protein
MGILTEARGYLATSELESIRRLLRLQPCRTFQQNFGRIMSLKVYLILRSCKHLLAGLKIVWKYSMTFKSIDCGFDFQEGMIFLSSKAFRPKLGPIQKQRRCEIGFLFRG